MADNSSKVHASFDISNHKGGKGTNLYAVNQHRGNRGFLLLQVSILLNLFDQLM